MARIGVVEWEIILFLALISHDWRLANCRKHRLQIQDDDRQRIRMSRFGFLQGGRLVVNMTGLTFNVAVSDLNKQENPVFGLSLDKANNVGLSTSYLSNTDSKECALPPAPDKKSTEANKGKKKDGKAKQEAITYFVMNFKTRKMSVQTLGQDFANLTIYRVATSADTSSSSRLRRSESQGEDVDNARDALSDSYLMPVRRRRRKADSVQTNDSEGDKHEGGDDSHQQPVLSVPDANGGTSNQKTNTQKATPPTVTTSPKPTAPSVPLEVVSDGLIPLLAKELKDGRVAFHTYFEVEMKHKEEAGLYDLVFHHCTVPEISGIYVNFSVYMVELNVKNYLSAGQMPLPVLYFALSVSFFVMGCYWFYILRKSREENDVFKIHYMMLVLVFVKAGSMLLHAINFHFIARDGHPEEAFAVLWYITYLIRGVLLFMTIVLIGAGWAFVKHILSDRDKKIFVVVIPLQVLSNVAQIIIEETEEGNQDYQTWKLVCMMVDLVCCGAILLPVIWSIRHLQEASTTDGKAAISLAKLKIFRQFYILIVCYIYFTRILVLLLEITVPFQYVWLTELFRELATFTVFLVTGYKFRPASNNPYLQVSQEDDDPEIEMDEVVTQSGLTEGLTKVNVKTTSTSQSSGAKQRESSHEYD